MDNKRQSGLKIGAHLVLCCMAQLTGVAQRRSALTPEEIAKGNNSAVVVIRTETRRHAALAVASGVIIKSTGLIVTNYHVLDGACSAYVRIAGQAAEAPVSWLVVADKERDVAILSLSPADLKSAHIGKSSRLEPGALVTVIGNPEGLDHSVTTGILSARRSLDGADWLQISAPISPGSSGGGVFDKFGDLVGIATASFKEGQNLNLAIPIEVVTELLNRHRDDKWIFPIPWNTFAGRRCGADTTQLQVSDLARTTREPNKRTGYSRTLATNRWRGRCLIPQRKFCQRGG